MSGSLADYLRSRHTPEDVNLKHKSSLHRHDQLALHITRLLGSMYTVYFLVTFVFGWMLWQHLTDKPFDPFPYVFMIFISNIIQLLLIPLVMVGQNIQNKHAKLRAEEEYKTTQTIHQDIEKILVKLDSGK